MSDVVTIQKAIAAMEPLHEDLKDDLVEINKLKDIGRKEIEKNV